MAVDFDNFPIWANNGTLTLPLFIDSGWVCGAVDPNNMNWWFNRTDNALLDLDTRVDLNTANIATNTTNIANLTNSLEVSGALGVYVSDSDSNITKTYNGTSPGVSDVTTLKTFNHVVQNDGDIHLVIGFEAGISTSPTSSKNFVGKHLISVNGQYVMAGSWGHTNATGTPSKFFGMHSGFRHINANYNYTLIGGSAFPTFAKNDNIEVKLLAYINAGNGGAITFGVPKLTVIEIRATDT